MRWSLASVSVYKRAEAHLTRRTTHGAVVTLLGALLGIVLAAHETNWYWSGKASSKMVVDLERRHDLPIHLDISFPAVPCAALSIDVMDASGSTGNDANHAKDMHLHKMRLDDHGKRVRGKDGEYVTPQSMRFVQDGSGAVMQVDLGASMSQMTDIEEQLNKKEGCRLFGDVVVRRVAGKIHLAVHQQSFVDLLPMMLTGHALPRITNMSHVIKKVAFGPEFPGQVNPLDGFQRINLPGGAPQAYKYFLKIVPTEYKNSMGATMETNQYSVSEFALPLQGHAPQPKSTSGSNPSAQQPAGASLPSAGAAGPTGGQTTATAKDVAIDFSYDLSPIMNTIGHSSGGLLHYLVRMCAVVGGVLSVTRMADKIVHAIMRKAGMVEMEGSSKARRTSSMSSYPGSARNSLPGDATAYVSGSRGYGGYPARTSSTGHPNNNSSGGGAIIGPGSHPLSRFNSGATTSSNGMVSAHSSIGGSASSGPLYSMGSTGSLGGAGPNTANGHLMGDAFPQGNSTNSRPSSGGVSAGGAPPTANGHVSHLIGPGVGSGPFGAAASQAMGVMQRQGSAGGAVGAPIAGHGPFAGGSRLASASGPMGSGGLLGKGGGLGQQYSNVGR